MNKQKQRLADEAARLTNLLEDLNIVVVPTIHNGHLDRVNLLIADGTAPTVVGAALASIGICKYEDIDEVEIPTRDNDVVFVGVSIPLARIKTVKPRKVH